MIDVRLSGHAAASTHNNAKLGCIICMSIARGEQGAAPEPVLTGGGA